MEQPFEYAPRFEGPGRKIFVERARNYMKLLIGKRTGTRLINGNKAMKIAQFDDKTKFDWE